MILQWSSLHLINDSVAFGKMFRQDADACLVDICVTISSFSDWKIVVGGGLAVTSTANTILENGERVVLSAQVVVLCGGNPTKQTANNWREQKNSARDKHDVFAGM